MDRRQSSYGPSWSDVEEWHRDLEREFGVHAEFRLGIDSAQRLGHRYRLWLVVTGAHGDAIGKTIHTDWRVYPHRSYKSVPEAMHALLVVAYTALDGRRERALSGRQERLTGM